MLARVKLHRRLHLRVVLVVAADLDGVARRCCNRVNTRYDLRWTGKLTRRRSR